MNICSFKMVKFKISWNSSIVIRCSWFLEQQNVQCFSKKYFHFFRTDREIISSEIFTLQYGSDIFSTSIRNLIMENIFTKEVGFCQRSEKEPATKWWWYFNWNHVLNARDYAEEKPKGIIRGSDIKQKFHRVGSSKALCSPIYYKLSPNYIGVYNKILTCHRRSAGRLLSY